MNFERNEYCIGVDFDAGEVFSVCYRGAEILAKKSPLFSVRLMGADGSIVEYSSKDAGAVEMSVNYGEATYGCFPENIAVTVKFAEEENGIAVRVAVKNDTDKIVEHIDVLPIVLKPLLKNGGDAKMLYPYNEGVLVEDDDLRATSGFCHTEAQYPSQGSFGIFPNMVCSQFMAYLFGESGLYIGVHDEVRGPKGIDYYAVDEQKNLKMEIRLYSGKSFGEDFAPDYDTVFTFFDGDWMDGADLYKQWFYEHLPSGLKKVAENNDLPEWYYDFPIILTYPVRGYHDMDEMKPNELFPYINVLPYVEKFSKATGARIMVLLMHWEGTAPWAPPYVFPPFGGEAALDALFDKLKESGHLLGVYCSGFSYTEQSNVLPEYDCKELLKDKETFKAFCAGRDNQVVHSKICEGQRVGYDLCVASKKGQEILAEAYTPLFNKHFDYVQILDQNHGGGQYFCYSREHNHPPCVGPWMTTEMKTLLNGWNGQAGKTLLGCESAASEPFMQNLLFSDNRYELTHYIGKAVPLYAYLYHEFLHNFMGNQVCNMLPANSYLYRVAYSFAAGDMPTMVLCPKGVILHYWGQRDLEDTVDEASLLEFLKTIRAFYMDNRDAMCFGNMVKPLPYETGTITYRNEQFARTYTVEEVVSSAFEWQGTRMQIFINYNTEEKEIVWQGERISLAPLSVVKRTF